VKATQDEYVEIGSVVTVYNGKEEHIFYIVGEYESDPATGRLSYRSPVGQALLRRRSGETAEISTPSGILSYEIRGIRIA
jgi:transcription elongation factor GreA